jgi:8-oxo-dGTP pyrophosphatase MutT (NUDIX family)
MHRQELLHLLANHSTRFMDEAGYIDRARANLQRILMMHHRKHDQWFQPGGHADGDADILRVALRETAEESGLDPDHVHLLDGAIFDVDIHTIPASEHGPQHEHVDIRFLVEIDDSLRVPGSDESHDVLWVKLNEVSSYNNNRSTWRMTEKTRRLRSQFFVQRKNA